MRPAVLGFVVIFAVVAGHADAEATTKVQLKPFEVTVRVFDSARGTDSGRDYVLPVDSPDAEHAASSTMANAASFTKKIDGGKALPLAFARIRVEPRC